MNNKSSNSNMLFEDEKERVEAMNRRRSSASCSPVPPSPGIRSPSSLSTLDCFSDMMDQGFISSPEPMTPGTSTAAMKGGSSKKKDNKGRWGSKDTAERSGTLSSRIGSLFLKAHQQQQEQQQQHSTKSRDFEEERIVLQSQEFAPGYPNLYSPPHPHHHQRNSMQETSSAPISAKTVKSKKRLSAASLQNPIGAFLSKPFFRVRSPASEDRGGKIWATHESLSPSSPEQQQQDQKQQQVRKRRSLFPKLPRLDTRPQIMVTSASRNNNTVNCGKEASVQSSGVVTDEQGDSSQQSSSLKKTRVNKNSMGLLILPRNDHAHSKQEVMPNSTPNVTIPADPISSSTPSASPRSEPPLALDPDHNSHHEASQLTQRSAFNKYSKDDIYNKDGIYDSTTYHSAHTTLTLLWNWRLLTNNSRLYHDDRWDRVSFASSRASVISSSLTMNSTMRRQQRRRQRMARLLGMGQDSGVQGPQEQEQEQEKEMEEQEFDLESPVCPERNVYRQKHCRIRERRQRKKRMTSEQGKEAIQQYLTKDTAVTAVAAAATTATSASDSISEFGYKKAYVPLDVEETINAADKLRDAKRRLRSPAERMAPGHRRSGSSDSVGSIGKRSRPDRVRYTSYAAYMTAMQRKTKERKKSLESMAAAAAMTKSTSSSNKSLTGQISVDEKTKQEPELGLGLKRRQQQSDSGILFVAATTTTAEIYSSQTNDPQLAQCSRTPFSMTHLKMDDLLQINKTSTAKNRGEDGVGFRRMKQVDDVYDSNGLGRELGLERGLRQGYEDADSEERVANEYCDCGSDNEDESDSEHGGSIVGSKARPIIAERSEQEIDHISSFSCLHL
ncbi:hypothetical protein EDD11_004203 [Mortierella claussenii]|nr:hypothetical protein EDD11_004203 [Mortierella claussenii]